MMGGKERGGVWVSGWVGGRKQVVVSAVSMTEILNKKDI